MARPGVVLRRPVGSTKPFKEDAALPTDLPDKKANTSPRRERKEQPARKLDQRAARKAALAYEREERKREAARRKQEAVREKTRKLRERAAAKAQAAFDKAEREHARNADTIEKQRAEIDARAEAEDARWSRQKSKLESGPVPGVGFLR